jgi:predicted esterase
LNPSSPATDVHAGQPLRQWGQPLANAKAALILLHGRGASAGDLRGLFEVVAEWPVAALAPEARANTWYPQRFIAPIAANEPWLSSALGVVGRLVAQVRDAGIPDERIALLGFSQGACLALEYAARNPARYGAVFGFSGGLIGPEGMTFDYPGEFGGAPVFLGVSDDDFHIPLRRVEESAQAFERMGAAVTMRVYPGAGHQIVQDEIDFLTTTMAHLTGETA